MNKIVSDFLLGGDKFMPEIHLRQSEFFYNACGPFTKNKERISKIKERGDSTYLYQNELDKDCFQQDLIYGGFKDLPKRTGSDEVLCDKAFDIAKNLKLDRLISCFKTPCFNDL